MKSKILVSVAALGFIMLASLIILLSRADAVIAGLPPPTNAPSIATPGPAVVPDQSSPGHPVNKTQALDLALKIDKANAVWESPWSQQDLNSGSGRVEIKHYPSANFDGSISGLGAENGPVWVITVNGRFRRTGFRGTLAQPDSTFVDGRMIYVIAEQTGHVLMIGNRIK